MPKTKETDHRRQKTCCRCYCKEYSEAEWLSDESYQTLLCKHVLPWLSTCRHSLCSNIAAMQLVNCGFAAVFAAPNLAGLRRIKAMLWLIRYGLSEANHLAAGGCQS